MASFLIEVIFYCHNLLAVEQEFCNTYGNELRRSRYIIKSDCCRMFGRHNRNRAGTG